MNRRRSILLYEFATGGGLTAIDLPARKQLFIEGLTMSYALAEDFAALDDVNLTVLVDYRVRGKWPANCEIIRPRWNDDGVQTVADLSAQADWTVLIAPETDGELQRRATAILAAGGRLLGPEPELIALAADKQQLCDYLASAGIRVPSGELRRSGENQALETQFPVVVKPLDGCGAENVRLVRDATSLAEYDRQLPQYRIEDYCPGVAASVAVLGGMAEVCVLPACGQSIEIRTATTSGRTTTGDPFSYHGGYRPLDPSLAARANRLAEAVARALPPWVGYLGIDMVLGSADDGREDFVIEVNPRLTTSYVGLRAAARGNLARAMLSLAEDVDPKLEFSNARIRFAAGGEITRLDDKPPHEQAHA